MHRQVLGMGPEDKRQADHMNRDKLDNRRFNLRIVEKDGHNKQNVPARGGYSEHRGVSYDKARGKWIAQVKLNGKKWGRRFDTEGEAAEAARAWRLEHMPFAVESS